MTDDITTSPGQATDRAEYVRCLIRHRCPEISERDIGLLGVVPDLDAIPSHIADQICDVISHMADRLDRLERAG